MIVVGIVGGIASGKSAVTREFERLGAVAIDADQIGHEMLNQPDVIEQLTDRWGPSVMSDGKLSRAAIAQIVFSPDQMGESELAFLESVSHPRIAQEVQQQIETSRKRNVPILILDAALLLKAGWDSLCDEIVYVDVDRATRIARARMERGWTQQQFEQREQSQTPLSQKRARANILIDNSGELSETRNQVRKVWDRLTDGKPTA